MDEPIFSDRVRRLAADHLRDMLAFSVASLPAFAYINIYRNPTSGQSLARLARRGTGDRQRISAMRRHSLRFMNARRSAGVEP